MRKPRFPATGLYDVPAHLATAIAVLPAVRGRSAPGGTSTRRERAWLAGYLGGSVAIDLDHLPQMLNPGGVDPETPRPPVHTFMTPLALALAGRRRGGPAGWLLRGAAAGTAVHLARDLATGSGVAVLFPLARRRLLLPYGLYAAWLAAGTRGR